jgi:hypothetical protein
MERKKSMFLLKGPWIRALGLSVLCFIFSASSSQATEGIILVRNGVSAYSICISPSASPSEKHAAAELQKFLAEISGAQLPILSADSVKKSPLILIGQSATTHRLKIDIPMEKMGEEGFLLKTHGRHLVIAGGRQRGTLYGAYTFLEQLGCRWFTREVSRIPHRATIEIPSLNEVQLPAFEYREPYFTEAWDKDWAVRNKTNGHFQHLDESTGGKLQYYPFVHSFYQLIPPEKYFQSHPEFFSLIEGKRRIDRGQLCLTNPEMLQVAVESVFAWIQKHPEATLFSVSQNDWEGWCECDNCRRVEQEEGGAHSGPILRFVNALAAKIEKRHPGKLIDTLAYWYSENPPARVRPRPNVRIRLCPIGVCETHPYEQCPRDAYFMKNLKAWSEITSQLYIWHYNTNFSHYLLPFPDFDELATDIPMYKKHGVVGLFLEGAYPEGGGAENAELRSYIMAKLMWNPNVDVKTLIDEFHHAYYGKSSKPMGEYFDLLHVEVRMPPQGIGHHHWIYGVPDFSEQFLPRAKGLFQQAELAAESESVRNRVKRARLSLDYLDLLYAMRFEVNNGWYAPLNIIELKSRFARFFSNVRGFGITELHEATPLVEDEKLFSASVKPYPVATLENANLRVDVAPDLNGRVVRMMDKKSGENLLRRLDPGEYLQPDTGGLSLLVTPDYYSLPLEIHWQLESLDAPLRLTLTGTGPNNLKLHRILRLPAEGTRLITETTLEAGGDHPVEVALQSRLEADPGNIDETKVKFQKRNGSQVEKKLIQPEEQPSGSEIYADNSLPDGKWRIVSGGGSRILGNLFPQEQVERAAVSWEGKANQSVVLTVWSAKRKLARGERLQLDSTYQLE